jgi:hypothetical protein
MKPAELSQQGIDKLNAVNRPWGIKVTVSATCVSRLLYGRTVSAPSGEPAFFQTPFGHNPSIKCRLAPLAPQLML